MKQAIPVIVAGILILLVAILSGLLARYLHGQKKNKSKRPKWAVLTVVIAGLLAGCLAFIPLDWLSWPFYWQLLLCAFALSLGLWHYLTFYNRYPWSDPERFWPEALITVMLAGIWVSAFLLVYFLIKYFLRKELHIPFALSFAPSGLLFLMPYVFKQAHRLWLKVPDKIYKVWRFPLFEQPVVLQTKKPSIIAYVRMELAVNGIEIEKRVELPEQARLGDFFRVFIDEYNLQNVESPIRDFVSTTQDRPVGWLFYAERREAGRRLLDPDLTAEGNALRTEDALRAVRTFDQRDIHAISRAAPPAQQASGIVIRRRNYSS